MSNGARILILTLLAVVAVPTAAIGWTAASVYRAGSIAVEVAPSNGGGVDVRFPAAVAGLVLALTPDAVLDEITRELGPHEATLRAVARELDRLPDCTIVEVRAADTHVKIGKERGRLVVRVESDGDRVLIEIPASAVRRVADRLASSARI